MGGRSSSKQKAEGDITFNNVDYSDGKGSSPLKNLNIGRENNLSGANFEVMVTDGGATNRALLTADRAVGAIQGVNRDSLNFAGDTARAVLQSSDAARRDSLDFGNDTLQRAFEFARQANQKTSETIAATNTNFTNKFSEFANRQTASTGDKVTDFAKWGLGAGAALVAFLAWQRSRA